MEKLTGLLGIAVILGLAYALSTDRRAIRWAQIGWGLALQVALAVFILWTPLGRAFFEALGAGVTRLLDFSNLGAAFVFGSLVTRPEMGFIFAFKVLPAIVFVGSLMGIAYYLGIMQAVVSFIAKIMVKTMKTSGAESLSAAGTVFVGQSEAPLLIRPYLASMTRSELNAIMTGGMATIAGSVMAAYIGMLGAEWAPHLLAASIMGAPAGLVMAKLLCPETEQPQTGGDVKLEVAVQESSVIEAAAKGASEGMHLAFIVAAMLIGFISLLALVNAGFGYLGGLVGYPNLTLELMLGYAFMPLALAMGTPWADAQTVGGLLGQKIILNEFVAYGNLAEILKPGGVELSTKAITIATFALCGFANVSSIAINIGCIGGLVPERRGELARLGLRAMTGGALASCMTATIAGILV
ncbi:MAG: NupC/NupG family nucleoside CNT transporter [Candidatus Sericytochromatia bacterium]|nr:NupC/NupG family nucleoside CNT transporter [Candidatus Sericytochromatia bacterium]